MPSRPKEKSQTNAALAERVQSILAGKGLTLYRVSQESAVLYGRSSPLFLPHNLYYDLRTGSFTPSIYQILALSRISGYRLSDWLRVFGFNLEDIARLQVRLPSHRTMLLDSSLTDPNDWVRWFRNRPGTPPVTAIAPLAQLLELGGHKSLASLFAFSRNRFLYAKIGHEDAFAFPDLVPGSIVRVNPQAQHRATLRENTQASDRIFLIEHSKGFCCCRARVVGDGLIVLIGNLLSYAQVELQHPREARVWGVVDLAIQPLLAARLPDVPKDLATHWKPQPLAAEANFGQVLSRGRGSMNLSFREAATMSRRIGEILKDNRYCMSTSSLCDHERLGTPPRDFHKVITLCSLYGLQFESFLRAIGITWEDANAEPIPDHYVPPATRTQLTRDHDGDTLGAGFLEQLLEQFEQVPFFLRGSLDWLSPSTNISLDDFFWMGGEHNPLHPYLANGLLAVVNRRRKKASHSVSKPWWQQPLYMILRRDGTYLAACCGMENDNLVVHPYTSHFHRSMQFRLHQDAEVAGQIVAILRRVE